MQGLWLTSFIFQQRGCENKIANIDSNQKQTWRQELSDGIGIMAACNDLETAASPCLLLPGAVMVKAADAPGGSIRVTGYMPVAELSTSPVNSKVEKSQRVST